MTRPELGQKVAREVGQRLVPARFEPWRGGVRTSLSGLRKYEERLPSHQRYQDPTRTTSLEAEGLPLYVDPAADVAEGGSEGNVLTGSHIEGHDRLQVITGLFEEWLSDESGYDEATWPELRRNLDQARTSSRRLFSE